MQNCVRCRSKKIKTIATVKSDDSWFCDPCFMEHLLKKVRHNIKKYKMFESGDAVCVGLSGGKDSAFVLHLLDRLKAEFDIRLFGLHISLGFGKHSEESLKMVKKLCNRLNVELVVVEPELKIKKYGLRETCSVCGAVKRYYLNKVSRENGATVVLTGHTLDDEVMYFIKNILGGNVEYISKQFPVLESYENMVKRAKPIYNIAEEDILYYISYNNIEIVKEKCPFVDRSRFGQRQAILDLEKQFKGFRRMFVKNMMEKIIPNLPKQEFHSMRNCIECGEPTSREICLLCRLKKIQT